MSIKKILVRLFFVCATIGVVYVFLNIPKAMNYLRFQQHINVLVIPNLLDSEFFDQFEKETNIKVNLTYFENYEELIVKLQAATGNYDLVMVSDYAARILIQEGLVKQIDKSRLPFWNTLYKSLFGLYFDPKNVYAIPYAWELFGLGIDTSYFKPQIPEATWKLLFDPAISPERVGMLDDAKEVVSVAALYMFGKHKKVLTQGDLAQIKQMLLAQKKRVVMYSDLRTDYVLVSKMAPVTIGFSPDIFYAMKQYKDIDFIVPKEGSFMIVDVMLIPAATKNENLTYEFLNFLYQPTILQKYIDKYRFFPVRTSLVFGDNRFWREPTPAIVSHLNFFHYTIPEQGLRDLWIALKS